MSILDRIVLTLLVVGGLLDGIVDHLQVDKINKLEQRLEQLENVYSQT